MNKYLKYSILIVVVVLLTACGKSFNYVKSDFIDSKIVINSKTTDVFRTDDSCEIFIRRLYLDSIDAEYSQITLDESLGKLIEVQYLIFNKNKVLYLSTVPSKYVYDKTEQYLLKAPEANDLFYPNCYFLNSFYFGTVCKGNYNSIDDDISIEFSDSKKAMQWNLNYTIKKPHKALELSSIDNFKIRKSTTGTKRIFQNTLVTERSVNNKIIFENSYKYIGSDQHYFKYLSFKKPMNKEESELYFQLQNTKINNDSLIKTTTVQNSKKKKEFIKKYTSNYPKAKAIYIFYQDTTKTKVKEIIIPFETQIKDENNSMRFKKNRVKFITPL